MARRRSAGRSVREVGEFPLIERLAARLGQPRPDVLVGIGDDVAVVDAGGGRLLLATCDVQVEGTHFVLGQCDPHRLGRKAAAINVSDIAAAGGRPTHFLSSLVLPAETPVAFVETLYDGLAEEAARWGADVIGGNVGRGTDLVIDLTLLGETDSGRLLRRNGARPGDRVLVSGSLGAAAAGLHLVQNPGLAVPEEADRAARDAFEVPVPRLNESRAICEAGGATAMIDVSDGLAADLGHVCDSSGVGVRVDAGRLPVAEAARAVALAAGQEALDWALGGGEDYELLLTAPADRVEALASAVRQAGGAPLHEIGEIVAAEEGRSLVRTGGAIVQLTPRGWTHF